MSLNLFVDPEQRRTVGLAGKAYVRRCHDWYTSIVSLGRCLEFTSNGKARS